MFPIRSNSFPFLLKLFTIEKENLFNEKGFPNCTKKKDIIFFDKKLSQFF